MYCTEQGHLERDGPLLIHEPSLDCSQASCIQADGGAQWTGNKSILRDSARGPEQTTCQLYALWLGVLPRLGGRNEALVGLLSTAFAQGNCGKWFSRHTGVFFNYALSGTWAELNNPHCSLCVFPVVQDRMHWVTGEGCYLAEVLPGGPETGPLLTRTPEPYPTLEASLGRGVSIPLSLGRDGVGCQDNGVSVGESQLPVVGGDTAGTSYLLDPKQLEVK